MNKLGFIGMGNMGSALAGGFITYSGMDPKSIYAYAPTFDKLLKTSEAIGFRPCRSVTEVAETSDTLVMACKPHQIEDVLKEAGDDIYGKVILSIAAGWTFDDYEKVLDTSKVHVQCIMPNTPVSIGKGVLLLEAKNNLTEEERADVIELLSGIGKVVELETKQMGAGMAVSGCAPNE